MLSVVTMTAYMIMYACSMYSLFYNSSYRSYNVNGKRDEMKVEFANHERIEAMTS